MYQGLAEFLQGAATWLQSVSLDIPVVQLSIVAWIMFILSAPSQDHVQRP